MMTMQPFEKESPRLKLLLEDAATVDALFKEALRLKGTPTFLAALDFLTRFRQFAIYNAMLIWVERPGSVALGTRLDWLGIGRTVNPDAIPIVILHPYGPVQFVYEYSDTSGPALPGGGYEPFAVTGRIPTMEWKRTVTAARKCGIAVEGGNYGANYGGSAALLHRGAHALDCFLPGLDLPATDRAHIPPEAETVAAHDREIRWRIRINRHLDEAASYHALAHELGHIYCGHLGAGGKDRWPDRTDALSQDAKELEAEAAAYVVCQRAGLVTKSAEYLAGYITESAVKEVSFFMIMSAANRVEARRQRGENRNWTKAKKRRMPC